jgi:G3E family GTPase
VGQSDVILLNKTDLATPGQLRDARAVVRSLSPVARLIEIAHSAVPAGAVMGTGRFDFDRDWPGMIRANGFFWLASRPDWVGEMAMAGPVMRHHGIGHWWACVPKTQWPDDAAFRSALAKRWDERWGDRRQQLVFIGRGILGPGLQAALQACLLRPAELALGSEGWRLMPDPFPAWRREAA